MYLKIWQCIMFYWLHKVFFPLQKSKNIWLIPRLNLSVKRTFYVRRESLVKEEVKIFFKRYSLPPAKMCVKTFNSAIAYYKLPTVPGGGVNGSLMSSGCGVGCKNKRYVKKQCTLFCWKSNDFKSWKKASIN